MIVPRPALILLTLVTFVPLLGLAVSAESFIPLASIILAVVLAVAIADVYAGKRRFSGLKCGFRKSCAGCRNVRVCLSCPFKRRGRFHFICGWDWACRPNLIPSRRNFFSNFPRRPESI